jgi:hypothetical protein
MRQALCLVLLLIAGQQGALVHELGHVTGAHSVQLQAEPQHANEASCALCPLYAQAASPAFSHAFVLPVLALASAEPVRALLVTAVDAAIPTPRSRGPPTLS